MGNPGKRDRGELIERKERSEVTALTVAVTDLARFCHRRGDIDHRFAPSPTGEQGVAGHQRVYSRRPASYRSEYALEYCLDEADLQLTLRGRADGYDALQGFVEEIKTCRVAPATIPEAVTQLHMAQGRLYGAIICAQGDLPGLAAMATTTSGNNFKPRSIRSICPVVKGSKVPA